MDKNLKRKVMKKMMKEKMTDMGYKSEMMETSPVRNKSRVEYPSLHLYKKTPAWLMNKELGQTCKIVALGKVISKSIEENNNGKRESVSVEIQKLGED